MSSNSRLYFIHCLTPVHVGTGEGTGVIDMPIMREKITAWPLFPGSSIKGVQGEYHRRTNYDESWYSAAFGKEDNKKEATSVENSGHAGALVLSDARMLAFPVASRYGTFAYVSSPLAIKRFLRDARAAGIEIPDSLDWEGIDKVFGSTDQTVDKVIVGTDSVLREPLQAGGKEKARSVELDEFKAEANEKESLTNWLTEITKHLFSAEDCFSAEMFKQRFVIVSDEAFQYFVTTCCEVTPRIRILSETKTVDGGALWYEEYIPTEAILYGLVWCDKVYTRAGNLDAKKLLNRLPEEQFLQVGANASVGKGRVRFRFSAGERS
ncbi:type III-B CRISPR module RAMP protein Cmr4 [Paenibacillus sp. NPDC057934]|uniref:type III-B CRISPR module RAMP protein Cmr4 n=1 Tax=Paenibacillus sp. NPDC057934 TaxID=3346282 RepID=UPI0036DBEECA